MNVFKSKECLIVNYPRSSHIWGLAERCANIVNCGAVKVCSIGKVVQLNL